MTVIAAVAAGVFVYLAVGYAVGYVPQRLRLAPLAQHRARPAKSKRQEWLNQAGVPVTPLQFWATSITAGAVTFFFVVLLTSLPIVALGPAIGVAALPRFYFAQQRRRVARARLEAWPEALRSIVASVSSSMSLHQSLVALGTTGPQQLRPVFTRYAQLSFTLDSRTALEVIREELADPVSDRVVEDLLVAMEQGPAIVIDILGDLAASTVEDLHVADRIETSHLEQKLTARAVFVLPFFFLLIMTYRPGPGRDFYATGAGLVVIVFGTVLSAVGMVIVNRLGRLPEEPRVFAGTSSTNRARA